MESHPQFLIEETLLPCHVTKTVIQDLEAAAVSAMQDMAVPGKITLKNQMVIMDDSGDEILPGAGLIPTSLFSDSTFEIRLEVSAVNDSVVPPVSCTVRLRTLSRQWVG